MEQKAQVQMELMLAVVGVIVVATAVALYLKSAASTVTDAANSAANK